MAAARPAGMGGGGAPASAAALAGDAASEVGRRARTPLPTKNEAAGPPAAAAAAAVGTADACCPGANDRRALRLFCAAEAALSGPGAGAKPPRAVDKLCTSVRPGEAAPAPAPWRGDVDDVDDVDGCSRAAAAAWSANAAEPAAPMAGLLR